MARREFTTAVYAQIVNRATQGGQVRCEGCGLVLGKKPFHVDHTIPDALVLDKSRKLTAEDGKLLGVECCHKPKTAQVDVPAIAKAKRREAKDKGITRPAGNLKGPGFQKCEKPPRTTAKQSLPPRQLYEDRP
jgi:hypothetical protein